MNLAIQILIGFLEQNSTIVLAVIAAFIVLYGAMLFYKPSMNAKTVKQTILGGIIAWIFFMLSIPSMTMSSLSQLTYMTDWIMLTVMSTGYAGLVAVLLYPVLSLKQHFNS